MTDRVAQGIEYARGWVDAGVACESAIETLRGERDEWKRVATGLAYLIQQHQWASWGCWLCGGDGVHNDDCPAGLALAAYDAALERRGHHHQQDDQVDAEAGEQERDQHPGVHAE